MSGHSKWHNIKRKKEVTDAKKGKVFSKMSRLITVAARQGGGDADANPTLRLAVQKAKDARMPNENITRAIKKGTGELKGESFTETVYEGFGPAGGAVIILCVTDNLNRTVSEIRNILSKYGGNMGTKGSASYIFGEKDEPTFFVDVLDDSQERKIFEFLDALEDHDDVSDLFHNYKFSGD
ncbi:YebC/PmpR family DNA-binding transcriptional regulator [Patescibacteria group bacterium]